MPRRCDMDAYRCTLLQAFAANHDNWRRYRPEPLALPSVSAAIPGLNQPPPRPTFLFILCQYEAQAAISDANASAVESQVAVPAEPIECSPIASPSLDPVARVFARKRVSDESDARRRLRPRSTEPTYTASGDVASDSDDAARDSAPHMPVGDDIDNDTGNDTDRSGSGEDDDDDDTGVMMDCPCNPYLLIPCPKRFRKPRNEKEFNLVRSHATRVHPVSTMPEGRVSCACWKRHLGTRGDKVKVKHFCRESGCVAFIAPLARHRIQPPIGEGRKPSVWLPGLQPPNLRSVTWINVFRNSSNQPVAAIENDQMREYSADYQCTGLSELFGYTISGSYVYLDRATTFLLPL